MKLKEGAQPRLLRTGAKSWEPQIVVKTVTGDRAPGELVTEKGTGVKLVMMIAGGIVLGFVLLISGCAALVAVGASAGADEVQRQINKHAITPAEFKAVDQGETRQHIENKLGTPAHVQETEIDIPDVEVPEVLGEEFSSEMETLSGPQSHDCIYYNRQGHLLTMYQFCFENGKLTSKASY